MIFSSFNGEVLTMIRLLFSNFLYHTAEFIWHSTKKCNAMSSLQWLFPLRQSYSTCHHITPRTTTQPPSVTDTGIFIWDLECGFKGEIKGIALAARRRRRRTRTWRVTFCWRRRDQKFPVLYCSHLFFPPGARARRERACLKCFNNSVCDLHLSGQGYAHAHNISSAAKERCLSVLGRCRRSARVGAV